MIDEAGGLIEGRFISEIFGVNVCNEYCAKQSDWLPAVGPFGVQIQINNQCITLSVSSLAYKYTFVQDFYYWFPNKPDIKIHHAKADGHGELNRVTGKLSIYERELNENDELISTNIYDMACSPTKPKF
jgi:hypothetical protein